MRKLSLLCLLILLGASALSFSAPSFAQGQALPPLVVFIEEPKSLVTASVTDNGPDGLTRLAEVFQRLGARTKWIRLRDTLPEDTSVVVLVRPRKTMTPADLAWVWQRVGAGNSLLVALDPEGQLGTHTEKTNGGLSTLTTLDQGLTLLSGTLIEPWFTNKSLGDLYSSVSFGYADPVPNPISDPIARYDLPVALWGARPLQVEPFGIDSFAWALVTALPQYVETATNIFPGRNTDGTPFELNIDKDQLGQVHVAAIGENTAVGSRVAMIGDGEFFQNGYGLSLSASSGTPQYAADTILTERIAAWLLKLPEDQYPALPAGMTWIAVDGSIDDWSNDAAITADSPDDASILSLNIQQTRAIRNDSYLYMTVETISQANRDAQLTLELDTNLSGQADTTITMVPGQTLMQPNDGAATVIPDAAMGISDVIELRLPLRVTGTAPQIISLCVSSARPLAFPPPPDCMDSTIQIAHVNQVDPAPLRMTDRALVVIRGDGVNRSNIRREPSTEANVITTVTYGTVLAAIGRSADDKWVQVENASFTGWVAVEVLFTEGNLSALPVTG